MLNKENHSQNKNLNNTQFDQEFSNSLEKQYSKAIQRVLKIMMNPDILNTEGIHCLKAIIQDFYIFIQAERSKLPDGVSLLLNNDAVDLIQTFIHKQYLILNLLNDLGDYKGIVEFALTLIDIINFLKSNCKLIENNKLKPIVDMFKSFNISEAWFAVAKAHLLLDHTDKALPFLEEYGKQIFNSHISNYAMKCYALCAYYGGKALYSAKKGLLKQVEIYTTKAESVIPILLKNNIPTASLLKLTYVYLYDTTFKAGNYSQALHYVKRTKELYIQISKAQQTRLVENSNAIGTFGVVHFNSAAYKETILDDQEKIKSINKNILQCKLTLYKEKLKSLQSLDWQDISNAEFAIDKKFSAKLNLLETCNQELLLRHFDKSNIQYTYSESTLILHKIYQLDVNELAEILNAYIKLKFPDKTSNIEDSLSSVAPINMIFQQPSSVTNEVSNCNSISTQDLNSNSALSHDLDSMMDQNDNCDNHYFNNTKQKEQKKNDNSEKNQKNDEEFKIKPVKKITFDDQHIYEKNSDRSTIFKLHGAITHRQYVCINPTLKEKLKNKKKYDSKILRNLFKLCERGKALGDSEGEKGFIIKNGKVKVKDCTKKYRFFGDEIKKIVCEGKEHTLYEINKLKITH